MSEQLEPTKPTDKPKEANEVEKKATQKESRENFTAEQQARRYSDNFTSFSDGTPAVDPLVLQDSKAGKKLYDASERRKQQDVSRGSAESTGTVIDYEPRKTDERTISAGMDWEESPARTYDSETLIAIAANDPRVRTYTETMKDMPPGPVREIVKEVATEVAQGKFKGEPEITSTPEGWMAAAQKISQLPLDKQFEVLGSGLVAGFDQFAYEQRERVWGNLIGTVQGTGEVATNLAKIADFAAYCIIGDDERAGKMGEEFGTALGQTIVGGIRLFQSANDYLYDVGFAVGAKDDYSKAFRDVAALGQNLDERWRQLPPREQERIKAKLITEIAGDTATTAGGVGAIKKATKFTEILDAVAAADGKTVPERSVNTIKEAVEDLLKAGKGGDWPVINERPSPEVVRQTESLSCVSACGEMITNGEFKQSELIEQLGTPCDTRDLASALGPPWQGEGLAEDQLDKLLFRGPWVAELRELRPKILYRRLEPGHTVVVDGLDELGNLMIRDPADGTRYEMTRENFLRHWSGYSVWK